MPPFMCVCVCGEGGGMHTRVCVGVFMSVSACVCVCVGGGGVHTMCVCGMQGILCSCVVFEVLCVYIYCMLDMIV